MWQRGRVNGNRAPVAHARASGGDLLEQRRGRRARIVMLRATEHVEIRLGERCATLGISLRNSTGSGTPHLITCRVHLEASHIHTHQHLFFYDFRSYSPPGRPPRRAVFETLTRLLQQAPFDQFGLEPALYVLNLWDDSMAKFILKAPNSKTAKKNGEKE